MRANDVVEDEEADGADGGSNGGLELLLRRAAAAAVPGEIPAVEWTMWRSKGSRRSTRGRGVDDVKEEGAGELYL
jgi:hypothetical protein